MSSWNLTINSKFRPFTYDEMVKPLAQYKEEYDKVDKDYSDLATQTEMWEDVVNQENSREAYGMYKKYSDELSAAVDDLSKGLNINTRSRLLGLKRGYAKSILPIAKAAEAMKEANEFRMKAGPDAVFEKSSYNSIDDFLHGKQANNKYQSKEALTKKTAAMTQAAMNEAMKDPEFRRVMGGQMWEIIQHTGGSYEDLKAAMAGNDAAQNKFAEIKARVMDEAGIKNYDAEGQAAIESAVNAGLYAGLDKPVRDFKANADYITAAQRRNFELEERRYNDALTMRGWTRDENGELKYDPTSNSYLKASANANTNTGSNDTNKSDKIGTLNQIIKLTLGKDDMESDLNYDWTTDRDFRKEVLEQGTPKPKGDVYRFSELPLNQRRAIEAQIGEDAVNNYYYVKFSGDRSKWWTGNNIGYYAVRLDEKNTIKESSLGNKKEEQGDEDDDII